MPLSHLLSLVHPPDVPINSGSPTLRQELESKINLILPEDIYDFAARYGSGMFSDTLAILNPFSASYLEVITEVSDCYRDLKKSEGNSTISYDIYPANPGLLVCGTEVNGGLIFWLTEGDPSSWPLILMTVDFQFERRDVSLTKFLGQVFGGQTGCVLWDINWVRSNLVGSRFNPMQD